MKRPQVRGNTYRRAIGGLSCVYASSFFLQKVYSYKDSTIDIGAPYIIIGLNPGNMVIDSQLPKVYKPGSLGAPEQDENISGRRDGKAARTRGHYYQHTGFQCFGFYC